MKIQSQYQILQLSIRSPDIDAQNATRGYLAEMDLMRLTSGDLSNNPYFERSQQSSDRTSEGLHNALDASAWKEL
jgi:hypothetical protein